MLLSRILSSFAGSPSSSNLIVGSISLTSLIGQYLKTLMAGYYWEMFSKDEDSIEFFSSKISEHEWRIRGRHWNYKNTPYHEENSWYHDYRKLWCSPWYCTRNGLEELGEIFVQSPKWLSSLRSKLVFIIASWGMIQIRWTGFQAFRLFPKSPQIIPWSADVKIMLLVSGVAYGSSPLPYKRHFFWGVSKSAKERNLYGTHLLFIGMIMLT